MKITKVELIIIITMILLVVLKLALPIILLQTYGSKPLYEVPAWVIWFLYGGGK